MSLMYDFNEDDEEFYKDVTEDDDEIDAQVLIDAVEKIAKYIDKTYLSLYTKRTEKDKDGNMVDKREIIFFFNIVDLETPTSHGNVYRLERDWKFIKDIQDGIETFLSQILIEFYYYSEFDCVPDFGLEIGVITQNSIGVVDSEILFSATLEVNPDTMIIVEDGITSGGSLVTDEIYYSVSYFEPEVTQEDKVNLLIGKIENREDKSKEEIINSSTGLPFVKGEIVRHPENKIQTVPKTEIGVVGVKVNLKDYEDCENQ